MLRHKKYSGELTDNAAGCDVWWGTTSTGVPMPGATAQRQEERSSSAPAPLKQT